MIVVRFRVKRNNIDKSQDRDLQVYPRMFRKVKDIGSPVCALSTLYPRLR